METPSRDARASKSFPCPPLSGPCDRVTDHSRGLVSLPAEHLELPPAFAEEARDTVACRMEEIARTDPRKVVRSLLSALSLNRFTKPLQCVITVSI